MFANMLTADLAALIRRTMAERGHSVARIAQASGVSKWSIYNVLSGKKPSLDRASAICRALGYDLIARPRPGDYRAADSRIEGAPEARSPPGDPRLKAILAGLEAEWRALNPHGRAALAKRFRTHFPEI